MTTTLTRERPTVILDPLKDVRHRDTRAARELADWLAYLTLGAKAPATLDAYERTAAKLLNAFPDTAFADFTDGDLMHLLMTYPAKSRAIHKAHLSSWFSWGYRSRRIPANPVDLLPDIKRGYQKVKEVFSPADVEILCSLPIPDGPLMTILFETGLRKAEARNLTVRRINLESEKLIVREGAKGSRERVVPVSLRLASAVANLVLLDGLRPDDYLWYVRRGGPHRVVSRDRPISNTSFGLWWRRCLEDADVEYMNPHTTRHTFANRWRQQGLDLDDLQILLGHASISTTSDLYVHTKVEDVAKRMKGLLA